MKLNNKIFLILTTLLLQGCQHFDQREMPIRNRANDYLRTSLIEPIIIPDGMSYSKHNQLYPLPEVIPTGKIEPASIVPPGFGTL